VSYHMRKLREGVLIVEVDHVHRRGAVEHFYATTNAAEELLVKLGLTQ
jgi:hypothetical protein